MIKLVIPGEMPGMNEIIAAAKSHHMRYSSMKRKHTEAVAWTAKAKRIPTFDEPVVVRCIWFAPTRRKDPDNIQGGVKFVMDGLVEAGVLQTDGWRHVAGIEHEFKIDRDNPRVEITITAAEEVGA